MIRSLFLSVFLGTMLLLWGCSLTGGDTEVSVVSVDSIEVISHAERSTRIAVTGNWRNTCGEVSRFESRRDGDDYLIRMYGEQPKGAVCGHAITPITGEWDVEPPEAGTYTFRFWQNEDASLDTTLTFE